MLIDSVTVSSPTLTSGAYAKTFGKFRKVNTAIAQVDCSGNLDASLNFDTSLNYSGNTVTVTVYKQQDGVNDSNREVATTANLSGKQLRIIATGY